MILPNIWKNNECSKPPTSLVASLFLFRSVNLESKSLLVHVYLALLVYTVFICFHGWNSIGPRLFPLHVLLITFSVCRFLVIAMVFPCWQLDFLPSFPLEHPQPPTVSCCGRCPPEPLRWDTGDPDTRRATPRRISRTSSGAESWLETVWKLLILKRYTIGNIYIGYNRV